METALRIMNYNPVFCTSATRIAEVKFLLKKYDYDEILVLDSIEKKRPLGFLSLVDMENEDVENSDMPSDISAVECMRPISAIVYQNFPLDKCLDIMRTNRMDRVPVVDLNGHFCGMLERDSVVKYLM